MPRRPSPTFRPRIEPLEAKRPLSGGPSSTSSEILRAGPVPSVSASATNSEPVVTPSATGFKLDRITNPTPQNAKLIPPFGHVLVQDRQPVPGQVYNILFLSVLNGTGRTFTASDGVQVKTTEQHGPRAFPVLTGDQQWKAGERIVFYQLTKKYYPLSPTQSAGFVFNFVSPRATAIPGPSGIFLRLRYNPATIGNVLDRIVSSGVGAKGHELGLPDTAIWEIYPQNYHYIRL
jgi:hypothetical protein